MAGPLITTEEFTTLWHEHGSAATVARVLGLSVRDVLRRRRRIEMRTGELLKAKNAPGYGVVQKFPHRYGLGIENGTVLVFSDAHFWPGDRSTAFKALLWLIGELQPKAVVCNGDAFDGAGISRHPRIMFDSTPSVVNELTACTDALAEIEDEAKKARRNVKLVWPIGNHDARFESRLAANAGEFEGVTGFCMKDHFPAWEMCWSCWPTEDVVIKHRLRSGIHAAHNNAVVSGKSIVTGHLHSLKVTPWSDYNGTRYGVDTGCLAETHAKQFSSYLEDNPTNWRSGFAVLTFHNGQMLWPEVVHVMSSGHVQFRGVVYDVEHL